jgi:hypothetical protein
LNAAEGVDIRLLNNEVVLMPFFSSFIHSLLCLCRAGNFQYAFIRSHIPKGNIDAHFEAKKKTFPIVFLNSFVYRMIKKNQKKRFLCSINKKEGWLHEIGWSLDHERKEHS